MTSPSKQAQTFPANIATLGRGKAQKYMLTQLHGIVGGDQSAELTDLARGFRGHLASIMKAGDALAKRGLVSITIGADGYVYTLARHSHA